MSVATLRLYIHGGEEQSRAELYCIHLLARKREAVVAVTSSKHR